MPDLESGLVRAAGSCTNCGGTVPGRYCGECGQSMQDINQPLRKLLLQVAEETLGLEGRVSRSVRLLILRPGALTAEYLAGRRARYSAPVRLYLLASAAYFVAFRVTRPLDQAYYGYASPVGVDYFDTLAKVFILLLPTLAIILAAVYVDGRRPLIQHIVFSLHLGTAALLWAMVLTLVAFWFKTLWRHHSAAPSWLPDFALWLYAPGLAVFVGYLVVALRRAYGSSWPSTIVRATIVSALVMAAFWQLLPLIIRLQGA